MKYLSRLVIACATISVLALMGCNNTKQASDSEPPMTPAASSASPMTSEDSDDSLTDSEDDNTPKTGAINATALNSIIADTQSAIEAGDFVKASETFDQFEDAWEGVEGGIQGKSHQGYKEVDNAADQVEKALKANDKPGAIKALQGLKQITARITQL